MSLDFPWAIYYVFFFFKKGWNVKFAQHLQTFFFFLFLYIFNVMQQWLLLLVISVACTSSWNLSCCFCSSEAFEEQHDLKGKEIQNSGYISVEVFL